MSTVSKILTIYNITHQIFDSPRILSFYGSSVSGDKNANYQVNPKSSLSIDLIEVQFDEDFLDTLTDYVSSGWALVTLGAVNLTATDVGNLKYAGVSGGGAPITDELVKVGISGTPDYLNSGYFEQDGTNHIRPIQRINDTITDGNKVWSSSKIAAEIAAFPTTDELVKVGSLGTADYLNDTLFERDITNHIRTVQRIDDAGTSLDKLWSSSKIDSEISLATKIENPRLVFKESFVGTGSQTTFTLTGSILNGTFSTGSWSLSRLLYTLPSHATKTNKKALYDSSNIFTRNRIEVSSINASGVVTLNQPPISGESFYIWYWYTLDDPDVIDDYYREDFIASMEAITQTIAQNVPVDTSGFSEFLGPGDTNVQQALDTLDTHNHDHNALMNIGLNTHIQIDSHISDTSIHYAKNTILLDDLGDVSATSPVDGDMVYFNGTTWQGGTPSFMRDSTEPTGFVNRTDSTYSFTDATRTFTIQPSGVSYSYYYQGEKFVKTSSDSIVLPDVEGIHYIYFENDILTTTTVYTFSIIASKAKVSIVYWDSSAGKAIYVADERHGMTMDGFTHLAMHEAFGSLYAFGLTPSGFTFGNGSLDSHAQIATDYGAFADDDILHFVFPKSAPAGLPVYYKSGSGDWNQDTATNFPAKSFSGGSGRLAYNLESGGTWSQAEVPDGYYTVSHIVANNDYRTGYGNTVLIQGRNSYETVLEATAASYEEINDIINETLPFEEWVPLAGIIYQTDNTYTNTVKARLVQTYHGEDFVNFTRIKYASTGVPIKHQLLDGIQHDDHLQYLNINGRSGGQTAYGGSSSGEDLILASNTSDDGVVQIGSTTAYVQFDGASILTEGIATDINLSVTPKGTSGLTLKDLVSAPSVTTDTLYPLNGVLYFDGVPLENDPMTTIGDLIYRDGTNATNRLPVGSPNQVLTVVGGVPTWQNSAAGFTDPMTTRGDLIYRDATNTTTRLPAGASNYVLTSDGTDIAWQAATGGASVLNDLTDVSAATPSDGNGIYYNPTSGNWEAGQQPIFADSKEPTGFPFDQRAASTISFVNGTRTLSIAPTASSFYFYQLGDKYTISSTDSVVISNVEGLHGVYYDSGVLTSLTNPTDAQIGDLFRSKALVSFVYWDTTNSQEIYVSDERHGIQMDGMTHTWLHFNNGTILIQGGTLNSITTDQSGTADTHAQFGVNTTGIVDEDLTFFSSPVASTTGLPVYYKEGASGNWRRQINAGFSVLTTGTGRLAWNEFTGGSWQLSEVTNNDFILCHIFSTNDETYKIISVMGQNEYGNLGQARVGASTELNNLITTGLPFQEFVPLATVIFQTSNGYSNTVQARTRSTDTGDDYVSWIDAQFSPAPGSITSHSDLANLSAPDHPASAVRFEQGGLEDTINIYDLEDFINNIWSATSISGFDLTENVDGTVDLTSGEIVLRTGGGVADPLLAYPIDATASSLILTDNDTNYVCVEYNLGNPQFLVTTSLASSGRDTICLYAVTRVGTTLYSLDLRQTAIDGINRIIIKDIATQGYEHVLGGSMIGETGTRNITLSAGAFYYGISRLTHSAFDTSVADTFTYVYQDGVGGWTRVTGQTQINNQQYDNGSGTLANLSNNRYGNHWVYLVPNTPDHLFVMYGRGNYSNLASAEAAGEPSTRPPEFSAGSTGILVGKIIIEEDGSSFEEVLSPFIDPLGTTPVANHNALAGLQGGTVGEYYHFTLTQHTDLTDSGDSSLHYHSTDRARANHTGTQPASTISNFQATVSLNTDVAANTAARHDAVTLNASAITGGLSLSIQEISFQAATGAQNGYLTSTDWSTFDGKQDALIFGNLTEATSSVLTITGGAGSVIGSGTTIEVDQADTLNDGYLSSVDWNTFNGKSDYVDPLTTRGDLLYRNATITTRLSIGASGQVLRSDGTDASWTTLVASDIGDFQATVSLNTDVVANTAARHDAVTLNASAIIGGLSLSVQEISFQAATGAQNGYLTSTDWTTFNNKADVIDSDVTYYVDGDTGSDSNDGSSWGSAKQTFGFLHPDSSDAIPRIVNAIVTINARGAIPSPNTTFHTYIKDFTGSGEIRIVGQLTTVETLTVDTFDNTLTNVEGRVYIGDSTKSWVPDAYIRHVVEISQTGFTGINYPIIENDNTTLRIPIYDTAISSTPSATIKTLDAVLLPEAYNNPGTPVTTYGNRFFRVENCTCKVNISFLDASDSSDTSTDYQFQAYENNALVELESCMLRGFFSFYGRQQIMTYCGTYMLDQFEYPGVGVRSSLGYYAGGIRGLSTPASEVCLYASGSGTTFDTTNCYFSDSVIGLSMYYGIEATFGSTYYQDMTTAVEPTNATAAFVGTSKFKDTTTCILLTSQIGALSADFYQSGATTEIKTGDTTTGSFSDFNAKNPIYNAKMGSALFYYDYPTTTFFNEYDNTSSGLVATNYQDAIDEVYTTGLKTYENTDIDIGTETVDSFADTSGRAVFWDYVVYKGANLRSGTVTSCWDASSNVIDHNEVSTVDVGDTSDLTLDVDISSDTVRLRATVTSNDWAVKVTRKVL